MNAEVRRSASSGRALDPQTMAAVSPLPPPEEVFADWLMSVPPDDGLEAAARYQIEIIDRSAVALHPDVLHLRAMLLAVAGGCDEKNPLPTGGAG